MSSPARVLAVLELFSRERPVWHADQINEALSYSRATGYRYVKDLMEAGFLQKASAGHYALGARIIQLDYQLRQSDPVLLAAVPIMDALAAGSGLEVVLSAIFGSQVVDTHHASRGARLQLEYGRGRPRPLFRGAAPNLLVAHLPRAALLRLYKARARDIAAVGLGHTWEQFRDHMAQIRERRTYTSLGEVQKRIGAAAVTVLNASGEVVAALSLVGKVPALRRYGGKQLQKSLTQA